MKQGLLFLLVITLVWCSSYAQGINNLVHIDGYKTSAPGSLGDITITGNGAINAILIPGWGLDLSIFDDFTAYNKEVYTFYGFTIPGFGNTKAPPMPEQENSYSELTWTNAVIDGIKELIVKENIEDAVIISCFTYSNVIAMKLALEYPELVSKLIIVSGMAKFMAQYPSYEPASLDERIYFTENIMAPSWFMTMDKAGWDRGNFHPEAFTIDKTASQEYWDMMAAVPIPVMVRYLLEYYCTDLSLEYANLKVPTLVMLPEFEQNLLAMDGNYYLKSFFHDSWIGARPSNAKFHLITISDTNALMLEDQTEKTSEIISKFIAGQLSPFEMYR